MILIFSKKKKKENYFVLPIKQHINTTNVTKIHAIDKIDYIADKISAEKNKRN